MTVIMSEKNQITIPKKIAQILRLKRGSLFDIEISDNRIELVPLEVKERAFTKEEYDKLDILCARESGKLKQVDSKYIASIRKRR